MIRPSRFVLVVAVLSVSLGVAFGRELSSDRADTSNNVLW